MTKVKNNALGLQGIRTTTGTVWLKPGETKDVQFAKGAEASARRKSFLTVEGGKVAEAKPESPKPNEGKAAGAVVLEAKHRGGGSYSVMDAEGKEVAEKLTKDEAAEFNAMSGEDQQAFLDLRAAS